MLKDSTYKEKFAILKMWMPSIVETVKKDLKNDHLRRDFQFYKTYFNTKNFNKLTTEELVEAYSKALEEEVNVEELGEFIANRWLLKNTEIYHFFEERLRKVSENFTDLVEIDMDTSNAIVNDAIKEFDAPKTYLFSVMNSVVFPKALYERLEKEALKAMEEQKKEAESAVEHKNWESKERALQQEISRLKDKYEKKLLGMQKKYDQDTTMLKKQVANLQRASKGSN